MIEMTVHRVTMPNEPQYCVQSAYPNKNTF